VTAALWSYPTNRIRRDSIGSSQKPTRLTSSLTFLDFLNLVGTQFRLYLTGSPQSEAVQKIHPSRLISEIAPVGACIGGKPTM
jgi:hypothetical protein